ncbi:MAG: hypothetical protein ACD_76C00106G0030 [uncultured bacterium]|nr:MAG: hypothetical protein ACD_76C00106G0030 [uncultured bacterium]HBD05568.1 penicillin-binding protein 2 [Candidatus Uhrbacteria bacterium]
MKNGNNFEFSPFFEEQGREMFINRDNAPVDTRNDSDSGFSSGSFLGVTFSSKRYRLAFILLSVIFLTLLFQSFKLQILKGDYYASLADNNRIRTNILLAKRGEIYDRNGVLLAGNVASFDGILSPSKLPSDESGRDGVLQKISDLTSVPKAEIDSLMLEYSDSRNENIILTKELSYESALLAAIQSAELPGFIVDSGTKRLYATDIAKSLSHVLGYVSSISLDEFNDMKTSGYLRTDTIGKQGLEKYYETILRGKYGKKSIEINAFNEEKTILVEEKPVHGANIILSIDTELQSEIEKILDKRIGKGGPQKQSVIALDPNTGNLLALISRPSFDSNSFTKRMNELEYKIYTEDENKPMFPRAILGEFPPGSTFKPIVASAALAEGIINEWTSISSVGGIAVSKWFFPDWKSGGHGPTNVKKAISESVNTFFYYIGGGYESFNGLGVSKISEYAKKFGLGSLTGIDLPNESSGFIPSEEWKMKEKNEQWYIGDTYHYAIGQGDILVTPLQIANATAVIANGGTLYKPRLVERISGPDYNEEILPIATNEKIISNKILQIIKEGMRQTVVSGSAQMLNSLVKPVAGKTGTAEWSSEKLPHAWFTSFGPYNEPEIVVTVLVEEAGEGSSVAVPIAYDIYSWWFENRSE